MPAELRDLLDQAEEDLLVARDNEAATHRKLAIAEARRQQAAQTKGIDSGHPLLLVAADQYATAIAKVSKAERETARAERRLERLRESAPMYADESDDTTAEEPVLAFPNADAWVRGWLLLNWRRGKEVRWCERWWLHCEAQARIEAMWRAWEHLRGDGALGPSIWWRDHGDYHLAHLTAPDGTFALCDHAKGLHRQQQLLRSLPRPSLGDLDRFIPGSKPPEAADNSQSSRSTPRGSRPTIAGAAKLQ